jgi:hypothetical protein
MVALYESHARLAPRCLSSRSNQTGSHRLVALSALLSRFHPCLDKRSSTPVRLEERRWNQPCERARERAGDLVPDVATTVVIGPTLCMTSTFPGTDRNPASAGCEMSKKFNSSQSRLRTVALKTARLTATVAPIVVATETRSNHDCYISRLWYNVMPCEVKQGRGR